MKTAIYTTSSAPMVELADTPVLGTGLARGTSSSLVRRTNKTSLATNTGIDSCVSLRDYETNKKLTKNFVAQDVALKTECCKVKGVVCWEL